MSIDDLAKNTVFHTLLLSMRHKLLPEEPHSFSECGVLWFAQVGIALPELCGEGARQFYEWCIAQVGYAQLRHTTLAHSDEIAWSAQSQVLLGKAEAVIGRLEDV